ncbi:MAG: hypothetical protein HND58_06505 [Planctomycetota bacterium]|nr:MAG: hypothetical protein HND58_06505 [Planctomycetota bacterium]
MVRAPGALRGRLGVAEHVDRERASPGLGVVELERTAVVELELGVLGGLGLRGRSDDARPGGPSRGPLGDAGLAEIPALSVLDARALAAVLGADATDLAHVTNPPKHPGPHGRVR